MFAKTAARTAQMAKTLAEAAAKYNRYADAVAAAANDLVWLDGAEIKTSAQAARYAAKIERKGYQDFGTYEALIALADGKARNHMQGPIVATMANSTVICTFAELVADGEIDANGARIKH